MVTRQGFDLPLVIGLAFLLAAIAFPLVIIKVKHNQSALQPSPTPVSNQTKASSGETVYTDPGSANWKAYTSTNYSFSYPPNFKINPINFGELLNESGNIFLSISSFDPSIRGIAYCEAYPNDKPRCEQLKIGDKIATIDWSVDGKSNAMLGNLSVTLNVTDNQAKKLFRQILSTFQFLD